MAAQTVSPYCNSATQQGQWAIARPELHPPYTPPASRRNKELQAARTALKNLQDLQSSFTDSGTRPNDRRRMQHKAAILTRQLDDYRSTHPVLLAASQSVEAAR